MVTHSDDEAPQYRQYNSGSGTFIGRDNHGIINNAIDETTQKILKKLAEDAPTLAGFLQEALQKGVVSPEVAFALEAAARNINEDVASALWTAGRNINEDVAYTLSVAGENIAKAERLNDVALEMERILERFERLSGDMNAIGDAFSEVGVVDRAGGVMGSDGRRAERSKMINSTSHGAILITLKQFAYTFLAGFVAGIILLAYLMHH